MTGTGYENELLWGSQPWWFYHFHIFTGTSTSPLPIHHLHFTVIVDSSPLVSHKCVSKQVDIGSCTPTNVDLLLIGPSRANFTEIQNEILSVMKIYLKMPSGKWHPFLYMSQCVKFYPTCLLGRLKLNKCTIHHGLPRFIDVSYCVFVIYPPALLHSRWR